MDKTPFRDLFIKLSGDLGDNYIKNSDEYCSLKDEIASLKTENEVLKERKREAFRVDALRNQHQIRLAYFDFYSNHRKFPTLKETQDLLRDKFKIKLSMMAISKHLRNIAKNDVAEMYKILDPFVYDSLFARIQSVRDPKAIEVWLKYVSGKTEKASLDLNARVESYQEVKVITEALSKMTDEELDSELSKQREKLKLIK